MSDSTDDLVKRLTFLVGNRPYSHHNDLWREVIAALTAARTEAERARKELQIRAKQLGVACLTHDLTHSLACGHCLGEALESSQRLRTALQQFADCDLNDDNCASLAVATARIRNIARTALAEVTPSSPLNA